MADTSLYPVPSNARAIRHASSRTLRRQRKRKTGDQEALALARALSGLADEYPRFKLDLNRMANYVRQQLRSEADKRRLVKDCLKAAKEMLSLSEIMDDTRLDRVSAMNALKRLMDPKTCEVEAVQRNSNQSDTRLRVVGIGGLEAILLPNGTLNKPTYFRLAGHPKRSCEDDED